MSMPRERLLGIGMLAVAAVMLLSAASITWGAINRWAGISAVQRHHMNRLSGRPEAAATSAKEAAAALPTDAATALAVIDPSDPSCIETLDRLQRVVKPPQRPVVATTAAFASVLAGKSPSDVDGVDLTLLKHLAALQKGELPAFPSLRQGDEPTFAIYVRTCQAHVAAAWKAGKADLMLPALSTLALLDPQHAESKQIYAVLAAIHPDASKVKVLDALGRLGDAESTAMARRLAVLAPARARLVIQVIPPDKRTAEENQQIVVGGAGSDDLKQLVDRVLAAPGEAAVVTAFIRCLQENQLELAGQLADKAPEGTKQDLQAALAYATGDVLTVLKLDPKRTDMQPTVTTPIGRPGFISFHLGTTAGLIPGSANLDIRIDGNRVAPDRIKRWGSLVLVEFNGAGQMTLDVKIGETLVFTGKVKA